MTDIWNPLRQELSRWHDADMTLPIWWRDDDAIAAKPQLDRLTALSNAVNIPVHLAVIPALAEPSLAEHVSVSPNILPVVHGWAHLSHSEPGQKKAEFGPQRGMEHLVRDAARGMDRLRDLFGSSLKPMFVPPWNRMDADLAANLADLGYRSLSTFLPRASGWSAPGLRQINTHLDPIEWRGSRSVVDPRILIDGLLTQLENRRTGRADNSEPFGLLTHHLVHDQPIWDFTETLLRELNAGPVKPWTHPTSSQEPLP